MCVTGRVDTGSCPLCSSDGYREPGDCPIFSRSLSTRSLFGQVVSSPLRAPPLERNLEVVASGAHETRLALETQDNAVVKDMIPTSPTSPVYVNMRPGSPARGKAKETPEIPGQCLSPPEAERAEPSPTPGSKLQQRLHRCEMALLLSGYYWSRAWEVSNKAPVSPKHASSTGIEMKQLLMERNEQDRKSR